MLNSHGNLQKKKLAGIMCSKFHFYTFISLGIKNLAKSMQKIAVGTKKNEGKTWFSQLVDKSMLLLKCKTSLYWAMKNCGGDAQYLCYATYMAVQ